MNLCFREYICRNLAIAGTLMAYLNSAINPDLYNLMGSDFRKEGLCVK